MICAYPYKGTSLSAPPKSGISRRYAYTVYYAMHGVFRCHNGTWSRLVLDWTPGVPLVVQGHELLGSECSRWEECKEIDHATPALRVEREVSEYRLGGGCALIRLRDKGVSGAGERAYLVAQDYAGLRRLAQREPDVIKGAKSRSQGQE